jgi:HSP20 family protein
MHRPPPQRRDGSNAIDLLRSELTRLLEDYLQPAEPAHQPPPATGVGYPSDWSPPLDVYESAEELIILAEIPGVDPNSIDLAVTGNVLSLRGVKELTVPPNAQLQLQERSLGSFHRQIALPNDVDSDRTDAQARHGVLTIRLPRKIAAQPRTIPIRPS